MEKEDLRKSTEIQQVCKVCGDDYETEPAVYCRDCDTPQHKSCFDYVGRCSVYACAGIIYNSDSTPTNDTIFIVEEVTHKEPKHEYKLSKTTLGSFLALVSLAAIGFFIDKFLDYKIEETMRIERAHEIATNNDRFQESREELRSYNREEHKPVVLFTGRDDPYTIYHIDENGDGKEDYVIRRKTNTW